MDAEKKKSNLWWPDVSTRDGGRGAALGGAVTACIVAVVTTGFALYATLKAPVLNITPLSFVDAVLFGAIAFGIWRLSRAAALAGLALYLMEQGYQWATVGPRSPVLAILFTLYFVHGVRGTFSYYRLNKELPTPSESEA